MGRYLDSDYRRATYHQVISMQTTDLFDDVLDTAVADDIRSLKLGLHLYVTAFIRAALRAHAIRYERGSKTEGIVESLVSIFLWDWGCEGKSCAHLSAKKSKATPPREFEESSRQSTSDEFVND